MSPVIYVHDTAHLTFLIMNPSSDQSRLPTFTKIYLYSITLIWSSPSI